MAAKLDAILSDLEAIVGKGNVLADKSAIVKEMNLAQTPASFVMVSPQKEEEVQAVVRKAGEKKVPIFTFYTSDVNGSTPSEDGIIMNFRRMDTIERIDERNLMAHVQRGVTFEKLLREIKEKNLTMMLPAAAETSSVACTYANRCIMLGSARYPEVPLSNMRIVLADGDIHRTGSHALSEEACDCKEDGGANLSRWYFGSEDIFGIMTRASVYLYPVWERRRSICLGCEDFDSAAKAIRDIPRHELGIECLMMNNAEFKRTFGGDNKGGYSWIVIVGFRGREKLVSYQEKRVRNLTEQFKCSAVDMDESIITRKLDSPWYVEKMPHVGFYAKFPDTASLHETVKKHVHQGGYPPGDMGTALISFSRGGCAFQRYTFPGAKGDIIGKLVLDLSERGAYFDLPRGKLAEKIYPAMTGYLNLLKRVKHMMDPAGILNPGRPVPL